MQRRKQLQEGRDSNAVGAMDQLEEEPGTPDAFFRQLLEAAPEALLIVDDLARIRFVNQRAEALFGYSSAKLRGRLIHLLLPGGLPEVDHRDETEPEAGEDASRESTGRRCDGSEFAVEVSCSVLATATGRLILAEVRNVLHRKRYEAGVGLLLDLSLAVDAAKDLADALKLILEKLCGFTHWSMGQVWLPSPGGECLECNPAWCAREAGLDAFRHASETLTLLPGEGLPGRAWAAGAPVWVRDLGEAGWAPRTLQAKACGLRAGVAIPALGDGRVVAVLEFFQQAARSEDESLVRILSIAAAQLGNQILRKRAEDELRRSETLYRQIIDTAYEGVATVDARGVVTYGNQRLADMLGYPLTDLVGRSVQDFVFEEDQSRAAQLLGLRRTRPPEQFEFRLRRKDGSVLWTIIAASAIFDQQGDYLGALGMFTGINERKAMENALRENEQLFRRVLDTLPVGVWITDSHGRIINGNPAGHRIWAGARYTNPEEYGEYKAWRLDTGERITTEEWALARAIKRGEISLNEVLEIEAFDGTHKVILNSAMPLRTPDGQITGAIVVNEEITEKKRLEAEQAKAFAREKRIAGELQECFRPSVPPHITGYVLGHTCRPALDEALLGGDFYDVFRLGPNRFGIVIGDVSGKGLDAAVHTVMAKYFLRGYAAEYSEPAKVVQLLNEVLAEEMAETQFLTLFYGVLDAPTGRLHYVNAGHEPVLALSPGEEIPCQLGATGPLVGAFPGLQFREEFTVLGHGASLLLYTDGVSEARNDHRFLQTEGVAALFVQESARYQGQHLVDHLVQEVMSFAQGEQRDDLTLLLIQREGG